MSHRYSFETFHKSKLTVLCSCIFFTLIVVFHKLLKNKAQPSSHQSKKKLGLADDIRKLWTNIMSMSLIRRMREARWAMQSCRVYNYQLMQLICVWIIQQFILHPTTQALFLFHHSFWLLRRCLLWYSLLLPSLSLTFAIKSPEMTIFTW